MGRPRKHPRRRYRAVESGVYFDQETGEELVYYAGQTILPDSLISIPMASQEKMARKLAGHRLFEPLDDDPPVEQATAAPGELRDR